jgi:guanosine-3',5'-bis(diphosphate) 3'-pyrophosphohydrolase
VSRTRFGLVVRARQLALRVHQGQRYGPDPYSIHLEHVVEVVERYPHDEILRAAAWLHDALEDTDLTEPRLRAELGDEVTTLVIAVTDDPGHDRATRKAGLYPRLAAAPPAARALKLADRIANLEACRARGRADMLTLYRSEHLEFRRRLHRPGEHAPQWQALQSLIE